MAAAPDDDARRTLAELEAKLRDLERELLRGYEPDTVEADPFAAPDEPPTTLAPDGADAHAPPTAVAPDEAEPAAPPSAVAPEEPEPPAPPVAFDAGEWATPETREPAAPEPPGEAEPAYEGGLAREPLPTFEPAAADEAEPLPPDVPAPALGQEAAPPYPSAPQPPDAPALAPEPEPEPVARLDHDALDAAHGMLATLRETIEEMGLTAARVTTEARAVADDHGRALGRMARAAQAAARAEEAAHEAGRLAATVVVEAGPFADAGAVTALRDALASQPGARDAYVRGVEGGRAVIEVHLAPPNA